MSAKENPPDRNDIRTEPDASAGVAEEYPHQGVETPSEQMEPEANHDPDTVAAVTDPSRTERNRRNHANGVSS